MLLSKSIQKIIHSALKEDSAHRDITTRVAISPNQHMRAEIIVKENGVLCGIEVAKAVFKQINRKVIFKTLKKDGKFIAVGQRVAIVEGAARDVLAGERVSLNFLSFLSGIATITEEFVGKAKGTRARIMDTRKTIPNLRQLQRYAVSTGGGYNHRSSLSTGVIVKDNHLKSGQYISKGKLNNKKVAELIKRLKRKFGQRVEVEVETLTELNQLIQYKPDIIMLDNFSLANLKKAVRRRNQNFPKVKLEASGGITLKNIRAVAHTGVDQISIGRLTHSLKALDFSLELI